LLSGKKARSLRQQQAAADQYCSHTGSCRAGHGNG
jgi:hypothetical protein